MRESQVDKMTVVELLLQLFIIKKNMYTVFNKIITCKNIILETLYVSEIKI